MGVIASTVGLAAVNGLLGITVGDFVYEHSKHSHLHTRNYSNGEKQDNRNHLRRDLPGTVVEIAVMIPIASDSSCYITIEQELPSPDETSQRGQRVEVVAIAPEGKASQYFRGQHLTPEQINELIDVP